MKKCQSKFYGFYLLILMLSLGASGKSSFQEVSDPQNKTEYFAEFYSYEGNPLRPSESHSFARFVKTVNGKPIEKIDISWLPKEDFIRPGGRMPLFEAVPGKNYSLEETQALAAGKRIFNHGKFSTDESLFTKAKERAALLQSGSLSYQMLAGVDSKNTVNCIHAILGAVSDSPTGNRYGVKATQIIIDDFIRRGLMVPGETQSGQSFNSQLDLKPHTTSEISSTKESQRGSHR